MKTLLICGNGMSGEIIPEIKKWGFKVCLLSEFPFDTNIDFVDRYVRVNTLKANHSLEAAKKLASEGWNFDAVISLCWDCPISVSTIANHFGLRAISIEVAKQATYKDKRIKLLTSKGINVPKHIVINARNANFNLLNSMRYPLVCKPLDLSGSTGVVFIENQKYLKSALESTSLTLVLSNRSEVMFEEFIEGIEYSAEGLMVDGQFQMTGLSERRFDKSARPAFVEIGDILPTTLSHNMVAEVHRVCETAARALEIQEGVVKYDLIISNDKIYVLEVTPRLGGPRFGTEIIPLSNGTNLLKAALQQLTGEQIDYSLLQPQYERGVVAFTIFSKSTGIIQSIQGLEEIKKIDGFYDFKWWKDGGYSIGDKVVKGKKLGYYIVSAENREVALAKASNIERCISIEVM